jgi:hypothetical protein
MFCECKTVSQAKQEKRFPKATILNRSDSSFHFCLNWLDMSVPLRTNVCQSNTTINVNSIVDADIITDSDVIVPTEKSRLNSVRVNEFQSDCCLDDNNVSNHVMEYSNDLLYRDYHHHYYHEPEVSGIDGFRTFVGDDGAHVAIQSPLRSLVGNPGVTGIDFSSSSPILYDTNSPNERSTMQKSNRNKTNTNPGTRVVNTEKQSSSYVLHQQRRLNSQNKIDFAWDYDTVTSVHNMDQPVRDDDDDQRNIIPALTKLSRQKVFVLFHHTTTTIKCLSNTTLTNNDGAAATTAAIHDKADNENDDNSINNNNNYMDRFRHQRQMSRDSILSKEEKGSASVDYDKNDGQSQQYDTAGLYHTNEYRRKTRRRQQHDKRGGMNDDVTAAVVTPLPWEYSSDTDEEDQFDELLRCQSNIIGPTHHNDIDHPHVSSPAKQPIPLSSTLFFSSSSSTPAAATPLNRSRFSPILLSPPLPPRTRSLMNDTRQRLMLLKQAEHNTDDAWVSTERQMSNDSDNKDEDVDDDELELVSYFNANNTINNHLINGMFQPRPISSTTLSADFDTQMRVGNATNNKKRITEHESPSFLSSSPMPLVAVSNRIHTTAYKTPSPLLAKIDDSSLLPPPPPLQPTRNMPILPFHDISQDFQDKLQESFSLHNSIHHRTTSFPVLETPDRPMNDQDYYHRPDERIAQPPPKCLLSQQPTGIGRHELDMSMLPLLKNFRSSPMIERTPPSRLSHVSKAGLGYAQYITAVHSHNTPIHPLPHYGPSFTFLPIGGSYSLSSSPSPTATSTQKQKCETSLHDYTCQQPPIEMKQEILNIPLLKSKALNYMSTSSSSSATSTTNTTASILPRTKFRWSLSSPPIMENIQ